MRGRKPLIPPDLQRNMISSRSVNSKLRPARARILSWASPKYTASAPAEMAACSEGKQPAGASSSTGYGGVKCEVVGTTVKIRFVVWQIRDLTRTSRSGKSKSRGRHWLRIELDKKIERPNHPIGIEPNHLNLERSVKHATLASHRHIFLIIFLDDSDASLRRPRRSRKWSNYPNLPTGRPGYGTISRRWRCHRVALRCGATGCTLRSGRCGSRSQS